MTFAHCVCCSVVWKSEARWRQMEEFVLLSLVSTFSTIQHLSIPAKGNSKVWRQFMQHEATDRRKRKQRNRLQQRDSARRQEVRQL